MRNCQHVMGCWVTDITAKGYHDPELPHWRELVALGFHWPLAYWNTDGECWMIRDIATDAEFFNPLHDFNDAWLVLKQFYEDHQDGELVSPLAYHLGITWYEQAYNSKVFQMNLEQLVNLTPEKLCIAILKTLSVNIEASK